MKIRVHEVRTLRELADCLGSHRVSVVLCQSIFTGGNWRDALACVSDLPSPPRLIVTSEAVDNWLWAEVLNLGGYDVLAQPFRELEVVRILSSAVRRWEGQTTSRPRI
jgi:hypothetical protein